ncbi:MAG: SBBP repeat-containing protein [Bacteroidota bacterium]|nr:SBBP repeat-containing protein [Bacteroidota bacterium]
MSRTFLAFAIILLNQITIFAQAPAFQWAHANGGAGQQIARKVKTDALGNAYTVGTFEGIVDFDPGPATYTLSSISSRDIYVTMLDGNGNLMWARSFGSSSSSNVLNMGRSIELDASGNVYITGEFQGVVDFDPGPLTSNLTSNGNDDIFILKLNSSGNFIWAKQIGGSSADEAYSIALDAGANIYVCGNFLSTVDFDPNVGIQNLTASGLHDSFILKLNSSGNYVWAKSFGSSLSDACNDVSIDGLGNVLCIGMFQNTVDFDPGPSTYTLQTNGGWDIFVSKLDASGNFIWARSIGGTGTDRGEGITSDASGNIYCVGTFINSVDFDPGPGNNILTATGTSRDVYLLKLDASGSFSFVNQIGSNLDENATDIFSSSTNLYISGSFQGTVDFDSGAASYTSVAAGTSYDGYVTKVDLSGNFLGLATITGTLNEVASGVTLDQAANLFVVGYFQGICDFDPNITTYTLSSISQEDAFVLKLSSCIIPIAPLNITPLPNQTICSSANTTLLATSNGTINWYATPTSTLSLGTGTAFTTPTLAVGSYTYYAETIGCASSLTRTAVSIIVNPNPTITVNSGSICSGNSFTILPSGANNFTIQGGSSIVSPTSTSNYTVIGASSTGCVSQNFATANVIVNSNPTITAVSSETNLICVGQSATLTANGALSYTFNPGGTGASIVVSPTVTTTYSVIGLDANGCQNTSAITQSVSACTGLNNFNSSNELEFHVYPNPTNGSFELLIYEDSELTITNVNGQLILNQTLSAGKNSINLINYANGIYIISTKSKSKCSNSKLIKQ